MIFDNLFNLIIFSGDKEQFCKTIKYKINVPILIKTFSLSKSDFFRPKQTFEIVRYDIFVSPPIKFFSKSIDQIIFSQIILIF